ncbi:hypothetical protein [Cellulomonas sp. NPDC089187]|uniref:hypothetical protein n=1 Tax=Cellulomonas sp. NPDC089187 TaxID=3154970 RepID=UPI0034443D8C
MSEIPGWPILFPADHAARELERRERRGELVRVRRGAYARIPRGSPLEQKTAQASARIHAVAAQLSDAVTVSHDSAALLWGLPLLGVPTRTHVIQRSRPGGHRDPTVVRHRMALEADEQTTLHGVRITTLERTVVDCVCSMSARAGLVVADAALRSGVDWEVIAALLDRRQGRRGIAMARLVWQRADGGAESPGETLTRAALLDAGLPAVTTQIAVRTRRGTFRIDLGWPDWRVGIEFDGKVKYTSAMAGDSVDALFREKQRHDALTEAGWRLLRVTWDDLRSPPTLAARAVRALRGEFGG